MAATRRLDPPPFRANEFVPIVIGTALWGIACIVLLTQHHTMAARGQGWWLWVTVTGFALGIWGLFLLRLHRRNVEKAAARGTSQNSASQSGVR